MIFTSTLKEERPMTSRRRPVVPSSVSLLTADGATITDAVKKLMLRFPPASMRGRAR
jgi:hypothetical protein